MGKKDISRRVLSQFACRGEDGHLDSLHHVFYIKLMILIECTNGRSDLR